MFALEDIPAAEFVYQYTGSVLSQDEAERSDVRQDENELCVCLNADSVLYALRSGNKSKF